MRPVEFHERVNRHLLNDPLGAILVGTAGDLLVGAAVPARSADAQIGTVLLASNRTNQLTCLKVPAEILRRDDRARPPREWGVEIVLRRGRLADLVGGRAVEAFETQQARAQAGDGEQTIIMTIEVPGESTQLPPTVNGVPVELDMVWYTLHAPEED